jgi:hypothetical protein
MFIKFILEKLLLNLLKNCFFRFVIKFVIGIFLWPFAQGANEISCSKGYYKELYKNLNLSTCDLSSQTIDQPNISFSSNDSTVTVLIANFNKKMKFIPENIAEKLPYLERIEFDGDALKLIEKKHFRGLRGLKYLSLDSNQIETIEKGSFDDLEKLKILGLNNNKIGQIEFLPENIFSSSLQNLQFLRLHSNKISFLDENIFANLINVEGILLSYNSLTEISKNLFSKNSKLAMIWLDGNDIKSLSSTLFDGNNNLKYVGLAGTCANHIYFENTIETIREDLKTKCADHDEEKRNLTDKTSELKIKLEEMDQKMKQGDLERNCTKTEKGIDWFCKNIESVRRKLLNEHKIEIDLTKEITKMKKKLCVVESQKKSIFDNVLMRIFFGNWKYILS